MKVKTLALIFLLVSSGLLKANDSKYLIKEMESLRSSLNIDDPKRIDLTLRLADLYFDVSIQEGKKEDTELLKKDRLKSLELYKHSLNGTDNLKAATGLNRIKIQFQLGRLLTRLDEGKTAEPYYLSIIENKDSPSKMVEQSALALAEYYEELVLYAPAKKFYDLAISLCSVKDSCNYANYRLAWLLYKDTKLDAAIATMEKSLWNEGDYVRENSLSDLLLFMSNKDSDGQAELIKIKEIAQRAKKPELVSQLVEAFYVAGNRLAGSTLLSELNKSDPNLYYEIRLLEEFYGFRKWDKVENYLSIIEKRKSSDMPIKKEEAAEVLTIFRRFIVQVDAEMQVNTGLSVFLKRSIDVYLNFYPNDELRKKMQAGWLSAESDKSLKVSKLDKWINEDIAFGVDSGEIRKLRQTRLSLAQEIKNQDVVIIEALAIAEILKGTKEANEFSYVAARELYEQKKFAEALPYFQSIIVDALTDKQITNWVTLSQNLILDIYNHQKNYDGIISQVALWGALAQNSSSPEIQKETTSMNQILIQAKFENAMLMKDDPKALESFYQFCMDNIYPEKSCENAKILSIKYKDQNKLVALLEKSSDEKALIVEYELMGRYNEAARLKEKIELKLDPSIETYLKIAFLYELDQNLLERDRILSKMIEVINRQKKIPADLEKMVYLALEEANLLNERALIMPWSLAQKLKLATRLEALKPTLATQKIILAEKDSHGPLWSKLILAQSEAEYTKANKIKFYGARSKTLFKQRTQALEKFAAMAKPVLDGADLETRVYLLHMLKMAYKNIANEILNTPIPEGLDDETLAAVTTQISTLADPFDRVNEDYDALLSEQLTAINDESLRSNVQKNIAGDVKNYSNFIKMDSSLAFKDSKILSVAEQKIVSELKMKLLNNPEDKSALISLKNFYAQNNYTRAAAYYSGRVENLNRVE